MRSPRLFGGVSVVFMVVLHSIGSAFPVRDSLIEECYKQAAEKNVLAAVNPEIFFGYWSVCADGKGYGYGKTYPSLDGNQMTEALLWLGQTEVVLANWDYVRSYQKANGHLPMRIDDKGIGLYKHHVPGDPLRALGATTYIQNARAIFRHTKDRKWLASQIASVNLATEFLISLIEDDGIVGGAGYYVENPLRREYDGVTQCMTYDALRIIAQLNVVCGDKEQASRYSSIAEKVKAAFRKNFWRDGHCIEYLTYDRKPVCHGYTDVDWAAIAVGILSSEQEKQVWSKVRNESGFYYGGMPTAISTRPDLYPGPGNELAAMGRVWYLECRARAKMGDRAGIIKSLRQVCLVGKENGWYWRERYFPSQTGKPIPGGRQKYCEYAANLIRIVNEFL